MTAAAPAQRTKYHLITSDRLYLLGLELMDGAVAEVNSAGRITKAQAFRYRDGLIIALLAMIPLRSAYSYGAAHWPPSGEGWRSMGA